MTDLKKTTPAGGLRTDQRLLGVKRGRQSAAVVGAQEEIPGQRTVMLIQPRTVVRSDLRYLWWQVGQDLLRNCMWVMSTRRVRWGSHVLFRAAGGRELPWSEVCGCSRREAAGVSGGLGLPPSACQFSWLLLLSVFPRFLLLVFVYFFQLFWGITTNENCIYLRCTM